MASVQLTAHAASRLLAGEHVDRPIMQVLAVESLSRISAFGLQRYRLKLSDGRAETVRAMLSTQMNHVVEDPRAPLQHACLGALLAEARQPSPRVCRARCGR